MTPANDANPLDEPVNPAIQQVLDAMEAAAIEPEDALRISLVLLNFVEQHHLENLEALLEADLEQPDGLAIAVWAADTARLQTARELLEEVLGEEDEVEGDGSEGAGSDAG